MILVLLREYLKHSKILSLECLVSPKSSACNITLLWAEDNASTFLLQLSFHRKIKYVINLVIPIALNILNKKGISSFALI